MDSTIRRFLQSGTVCGSNARELSIGDRALRLEGLSDSQTAALERYWGPYLEPDSGLAIHRTVTVCDGGPGGWLEDPSPGEIYRVEPLVAPECSLTLSYAFAVGEDADGQWKVALAGDAFEPAFQSLENAARVLTARMAAENGGFAMHSAGVLRDGRAWIFAGPSGSGKSTAVRRSKPCVSLGDDFGLVLPDGAGGWRAAPVPFDNMPAVVERPEGSLFPVAGIWRLFQDEKTRVERPTGLLAATSLSSCAALPWAMPDLAGPIVENISRFCHEGFFGHLHCSLETDFWGPLRESVGLLD